MVITARCQDQASCLSCQKVPSRNLIQVSRIVKSYSPRSDRFFCTAVRAKERFFDCRREVELTTATRPAAVRVPSGAAAAVGQRPGSGTTAAAAAGKPRQGSYDGPDDRTGLTRTSDPR